MSDNTRIEWSDATWNPVTGCTKVSPGCDRCYAERVTERFNGPGSFANVKRHSERLHLPLRWRKPRMIFVNSMSDLFHDEVPDAFIAEVFAVMALAQRHTFQLLTKRHARMRSLLNSEAFEDRVDLALRARMMGGSISEQDCATAPRLPLPNIWLGVSVEDQKWANTRIPYLLGTPAAVRFLSCEPLLGPLSLRPWITQESGRDRNAIGWVIVGGESGPGARPMHPAWARQIRDECVDAGVPFHFKQWGEWHPTGAVGLGGPKPRRLYLAGSDCEHGCGTEVVRVGKKLAGRELDGRTWDEYPGRTQAASCH